MGYYITPINYSFRDTTFHNSENCVIRKGNFKCAQIVAPYPPFGLTTITVLNIAAFLMLLGIYNSATLVSTNNELRKSIRKHASESKLLGLIGHAEMENEIQRTIKKIAQDKDSVEIDTKQPIELDKKELKKSVDFVIREVKKK